MTVKTEKLREIFLCHYLIDDINIR